MKEGFKRGRYHGIPVYARMDGINGVEIEGTNIFYDMLVDINIWLDVYFFQVEAFEVWIEDNN